MNRTLLNVLGIVVFALHASASLAEHRHDLNSLLKGKYRFTFHQTCTYSQAAS